MRNISKQSGASMPLVLLFLGMAAVVLTIAFKLFPVYYEHWQIKSILESYESEVDIESMTVGELESNFQNRLITNNVRNFRFSDAFYAERTDEGLYVLIEYQVRIPMYKNVEALVSFSEELDKKF